MKEKFEPKSSFIESAEYDKVSEVMTLTFKNGTQYNYTQVGLATWKSFQQSPDHSSYYSRAIKGRLTSVPIKRNTVGKKLKTPLNKETLIKPSVKGATNGSMLNAGLQRKLKRAGLKGPGTIPSNLYSI